LFRAQLFCVILTSRRNADRRPGFEGHHWKAAPFQKSNAANAHPNEPIA